MAVQQKPSYTRLVTEKRRKAGFLHERKREVIVQRSRIDEQAVGKAQDAVAGSYRLHYSIRGSGRDITVAAESSAEARRTVMQMIPGSVVTGVHRIK
jgi:hypothetical protein